MHRARDAVVGEHEDHAFDQPPTGEMDGVTVAAAGLGARGGFRSGEDPELLDEIGRGGERLAIGNMDMVLQRDRPRFALMTCL